MNANRNTYWPIALDVAGFVRLAFVAHSTPSRPFIASTPGRRSLSNTERDTRRQAKAVSNGLALCRWGMESATSRRGNWGIRKC